MLEVPRAPRRYDRPAAVLRPAGKVGGLQPCGAHIDPARVRPGDLRADLPGDGVDRELVAVGPVAAQVEDRLARSVARQLGLRTIWVGDPPVGNILRGGRPGGLG